MQIDGLSTVIKHDRPHSLLIHFLPASGGPRVLTLETLSSGKALLELQEGGDVPGDGLAERLMIDSTREPTLPERMVRAMAVYHFGLIEASDSRTDMDVAMLEQGFELGSDENGIACWIKLGSAMNVVIRNEAENWLPERRMSRLSMLCIIPERHQIRYMCENLATALGILKSGRPFREAGHGDGSEMYTLDVVDSDTVIYH